MAFARRVGLGDYQGSSQWHSDYLAAANGPAVDWFPNGAPANAMYKLKRDALVYQNFGDADSPSWTQISDVGYGASEAQKAAVFVAQGGDPAMTAYAQSVGTDANGKLVATVDASKAAELAHLAMTDPTVHAILSNGPAGSAAQQAEAATYRTADLNSQAQAALKSMIAAGGVFTDTLQPGTFYSDDFLRGMISRQQWVDDYISRSQGGSATNAQAASGKIPAAAQNNRTATMTPIPAATPIPAQTSVLPGSTMHESFPIDDETGHVASQIQDIVSTDPFAGGGLNPVSDDGGGFQIPAGPGVNRIPGNGASAMPFGISPEMLTIGGIGVSLAVFFASRKKGRRRR